MHRARMQRVYNGNMLSARIYEHPYLSAYLCAPSIMRAFPLSPRLIVSRATFTLWGKIFMEKMFLFKILYLWSALIS